MRTMIRRSILWTGWAVLCGIFWTWAVPAIAHAGGRTNRSETVPLEEKAPPVIVPYFVWTLPGLIPVGPLPQPGLHGASPTVSPNPQVLCPRNFPCTDFDR